jgi:gliding motility-associated-like protein
MQNLYPLLRGLSYLITCFITLQTNAQSITIDNSLLATGPYGQGSTIAAPISVNGCFNTNNVFNLYLSDASGNFATEKLIGSYNSFFTTFINGTIPATQTAGSGYKVRVKSTSPVVVSTASNAFSIATYAGSLVATADPLLNSRILSPQVAYGWCSNVQQQTGFTIISSSTIGATATATLKNEITGNVQTLTYDASNQVLMNLDRHYYTFITRAALAGVISTKAYHIINSPNKLGLSTDGEQQGCLPDTLVFQMGIDTTSGIGNNYPGNRYQIDWGDGTPLEIFTQCNLMSIAGLLKHYYVGVSCSRPNITFNVTTTLLNPWFNSTGTATQRNCDQPQVVSRAKIFKKPDARFSFPNPACVNVPVTFANNTDPGQAQFGTQCINRADYKWYINGVLVQTNIQATPPPSLTWTFTAVGKYEIKLFVDNGSCETSTKIDSICIEPRPNPDFKINGVDSLVACAPFNVNTTNLTTGSPVCQALGYLWSVVDSSGNVVTLASGAYTITPSNTAFNPSFVFLKEGKYKIRLTVTNVCGGIIKERPVTILGTTNVNLPTNKAYCGLLTINFATNTNHKPTYNISLGNETFNWIITGGSFNFVGGTNANSAFPQIKFNDYTTYTITCQFSNMCGTATDVQQITFNQPVSSTITSNKNVTLCFLDNSTTISATSTGPADSTRWFSTGTGSFANPYAASTSYTLSAADKVAGVVKLYYKCFAQKPTVCSDVTDTIYLNIIPRNYITSGSPVTICSNKRINYTPTAFAAGSTFNWTSILLTGSASGFSPSGNGNIIDSIINLSNSIDATLQYTITPVKDGCLGDPFNLQVIIKPLPALTATAVRDSVCTDSAAIINLSSSVSNSKFTWSSSVSGGFVTGNSNQALLTSATSIIDTLRNNGTTHVTVTYTIKTFGPTGCEGQTKTISIVVRPKPSIAFAGKDTMLCNKTSFQLSGNNPVSGTGRWTVVSGTGASFANANQYNTLVNGLLPNTTYVFEWRITGSGGCTFTKDTVAIINRPAVTVANAGTDKSICNFTSSSTNTIQLSANLNTTRPFETGIWNVVSQPTGGNGGFSSLTNPAAVFTFSKVGTYVLTWTINNDIGCTPSTDTMLINVYPKPVAGVTAPTNAITCNGTDVTINLQAYTGIIKKWQYNTNPINDNIWVDTLVTNPFITMQNLQDTILVRCIVSSGGENNGCPSYDTSVVSFIAVNPKTIGGHVQPNATVCKNDNDGVLTLTGNTGLVQRWEFSYNGTTWNQVNNTTTNQPYTNLNTTTQYRAMVQSGVCPPKYSDTATITVVDPVTPANAGADQQWCSQTSIVLNANTPSSGTGAWLQTNGPSANIINIASPNTTVNNLQPGQQYRFVWRITGLGNCPPSTDTVVITNYAALQNSINTQTIKVCSGQQVNISASVPVGGNGNYVYEWQQSLDSIAWSNIPFANAVQYSFTATDTVYLRRVVTAGPCNSISTPVKVLVQKPITNNIISSSQTICINNIAATIIGNQPNGADGNYFYQWQQSNDAGNTWNNIANATQKDFNPGQLTQTMSYRRMVTSTLCNGPQSSTSGFVTITVNPNAKAFYTASQLVGCAPFTINNTIVQNNLFPQNNIAYNWYAGNNFIGTGNDIPAYVMTNANDSVKIKLVAVSKHGCLNDSITKTFYTKPVPQPSFTVSDTIGCGPLSINFYNTTPLLNQFQYTWNFGNGQTSSSAQPSTITYTQAIANVDTVYRALLTASNGCDSISVQRFIRVQSKPMARFLPSSINGCSPMTVTFSNTSIATVATYYWDFGDGNTLVTTSKNAVQHTFYTGTATVFNVKLKVINQCGSDSLVYPINVQQNAILLNYAVDGSNKGCAPFTVKFLNASIGATNFTWQFGDGTSLISNKNIDTVYHTYFTVGDYTVQLKATNGCSDTIASRSLFVNRKPIANFSAQPNNVCVGVPINFTNQTDTATSFVWTFGDGSTSNQTNTTHAYTTAGVFTAKLYATRIFSNGGSCLDSASNQLTVVSKLTGSFTASDTLGKCTPFSVTFTNLSTPSNLTTWNIGNVVDTGDVVIHTFNVVGDYLVKMQATSPGGCKYEAQKTIKVRGPSGSFTYDAGYACGAKPIRFQASIQNVDSILWHFGDGTSMVTVGNIVYHAYTQPGKYVPRIELMAGSTCKVLLNGIDTIKIDYAKAGFRQTIQNYCGYSKVNFADTSRSYFGVQNYYWSFGDGSTSGVAQPQHTYSSTNTWPVQLVITTNSGCKDTAYTNVYVQVPQKPTAQIQSDTVGCVNEVLQFYALVNSIDTLNFYQWSFSNGLTSSNLNLTNSFGIAGVQTATFIAGTTTGCYDTAYKQIRVHPNPYVRANQDKQICLGQTTPLTAVGANTYLWSPTQNLSCNTCANTLAAPQVSTQYVVTGYNQFGCYGTDTVIVNVAQPFHINLTPNDTICIGQSTTLHAQGAVQYQWFPAGGLSSSSAAAPIASPTITTTYRVIGLDNYNCFKDTAYVTVAVGQYPQVNVGADKVLQTGSQMPLKATFTNGPINSWRWGGGELNCITCPEPVALIKKDACYYVEAKNKYGCAGRDTMCVKVFFNGGQVFIPNAFTPDGDGINDVFMIRGKGIKQVKQFRIFNRWGQVVFEKTNFPANDPAFGWDGKVNGIPASPDVFVYTCEVVAENEEHYTTKGNVTILK